MTSPQNVSQAPAMVLIQYSGEERSDQKAITKTEIESWLAELKIPHTQQQLNQLVFDLDVIRKTVPARDALTENHPFLRVRSAVEQLTAEIPKLIEELESLDKRKGNSSLRSTSNNRKRAILEMIELSEAVERAKRLFPEEAASSHKAQAWHDDAMFLALAIFEMFTEARQVIHFKSDRSPAARFAARALDRVLGLEMIGNSGRSKSRTVDAVRKALGRHPFRGLLGLS